MRFKLKHLGPISYYLGMEITRNREARTMKVTQKGYIIQLLDQLGMTGYIPIKNPIDRNVRLSQPDEGVATLGN